MNNVKVNLVSKDNYEIIIDDVQIGTYERSELRWLMQTIDNAIEIGLDSKVKIEPMTSEEYMELIKQGRDAAENDEDCLACGS